MATAEGSRNAPTNGRLAIVFDSNESNGTPLRQRIRGTGEVKTYVLDGVTLMWFRIPNNIKVPSYLVTNTL